ncbi:MAG TPA: hypothetical protein VLC09_20150 [Polyangiaceae bacterium]|nr:hypothetical protein [Polyangiaceae bacterium]
MTARYLLAQPEHAGEPWTLWDTSAEPWVRLAEGTREQCEEALALLEAPGWGM